MIVESMNQVEIIKEVLKDLDFVNRKSKYLKKGLRRKAIKTKNKYASIMQHYKSPLKNDWLIYMNYNAKKPDGAVMLYHRNNKNEFNAYSAVLDQDMNAYITLFTSHFFDRYNERFLRIEGLGKEKILKKFSERIKTISVKLFSDNKQTNKEMVFCRIHDGVALGYVEYLDDQYNLFHFKTFVSDSMLFESQKGDYDELSDSYIDFVKSQRINYLNQQPNYLNAS